MGDEWTAAEIRRIGYRVVDLIAEHLSALPREPVFTPVPPALARQFVSTPALTTSSRHLKIRSSRIRSATGIRVSGAG
jgi:hypothetical protein